MRKRLIPELVLVGFGITIGWVVANQTPVQVRAQEGAPIRQPVDDVGGFSQVDFSHLQPLVDARPGRDVGASGELIGFSHVDESGTQAITLVNTGKLWMAVYHVRSDGEIRLTSSRAIDADFSMEFNVSAPKPDDIRRMRDATGPR